MDNENFLSNADFLSGADTLPLGFGMLLAQNSDAYNYFGRLPDSEKQSIIDRVHQINSKEEMRQFVNSLV